MLLEVQGFVIDATSPQFDGLDISQLKLPSRTGTAQFFHFFILPQNAASVAVRYSFCDFWGLPMGHGTSFMTSLALSSLDFHIIISLPPSCFFFFFCLSSQVIHQRLRPQPEKLLELGQPWLAKAEEEKWKG